MACTAWLVSIIYSMPYASKADYNERKRVYMTARYHRRMSEARTSLGDRCSRCGEVDDLHFHHLSDKLASVSKAAASWSDERFLAEVAKCVLLCRGCHVVEHASTAPHGHVRRCWRGCRCVDCRKAASEHQAARRGPKGA